MLLVFALLVGIQPAFVLGNNPFQEAAVSFEQRQVLGAGTATLSSERFGRCPWHEFAKLLDHVESLQY